MMDLPNLLHSSKPSKESVWRLWCPFLLAKRAKVCARGIYTMLTPSQDNKNSHKDQGDEEGRYDSRDEA